MPQPYRVTLAMPETVEHDCPAPEEHAPTESTHISGSADTPRGVYSAEPIPAPIMPGLGRAIPPSTVQETERRIYANAQSVGGRYEVAMLDFLDEVVLQKDPLITLNRKTMVYLDPAKVIRIRDDFHYDPRGVRRFFYEVFALNLKFPIENFYLNNDTCLEYSVRSLLIKLPETTRQLFNTYLSGYSSTWGEYLPIEYFTVVDPKNVLGNFPKKDEEVF